MATHAQNLNIESLPYPLSNSESVLPSDRVIVRRSIQDDRPHGSHQLQVTYTADPSKVSTGKKGAYFGVREGRQPGIYYSGTEVKAQVHEFSGGLFQAFDEAKEAEEFVNHRPEDCRFNTCSGTCSNATRYNFLRLKQQTAASACFCCGLPIPARENLCALCAVRPAAWLETIIQRYTLDEYQVSVLKAVACGKNMFVTGSAGSGKSRLAKAIAEYFRAMGLVVAGVAPVGLPATSIGGTTLQALMHSYVGCEGNLESLTLEELIHRAKRSATPGSSPDVLLIDEVSMLDSNAITRLAMVMSAAVDGPQAIGAANQPFGGAQVVALGDFYQLSPARSLSSCLWCGSPTTINVDQGIRFCEQHGTYFLSDRFATKSPAWVLCDFLIANLQHPHRHQDEQMARMLDIVREKGGDDASMQVQYLISGAVDVNAPDREFATILHPKGRVAEKYNKEGLDSLPGDVVKYRALDDFFWHKDLHGGLGEYHKRKEAQRKNSNLVALKDHEFSYDVDVKSDMMVILVTDLDPSRGLVSGALGQIVGWEDMDEENLPRVRELLTNQNIDPVRELRGQHRYYQEAQIRRFAQAQQVHSRVWPKVWFANGERQTIYATCAVQQLGHIKPYSLLSRTQIPLVGGYAMAIHRVQGLTLGNVIADLRDCDQTGQAYTALSRVRSLQKMSVVSLPPRLLVSEEVASYLAFDSDSMLVQVGEDGEVREVEEGWEVQEGASDGENSPTMDADEEVPEGGYQATEEADGDVEMMDTPAPMVLAHRPWPMNSW